MSTKSRKSLSSWQCDKCQCLLMQKDFSLHEVDCPPCTEKWNYSFIFNEVLYSTVEVLDTSQERFKNISASELADEIIFISASAMELCNISAESFVVIATKDGLIVKKAFPNDDKNLTSISLTKHAIELNNIEGQVKIQLLKSTVYIAEEIVLSQQGKNKEKRLMSDINVEFDSILKNINEYQIFTVGNKISVSCYGKKLIYKIVEIKRDKSEKKQIETADIKDLSESFKKVSLTIDPTNITFHKALYRTKYTILNTTDENKTNIPKKYKTEDIGGYDALISNLRDAVAIGIGKYRSMEYFKEFASKGILLYGPVGVGKSLIANAIISEYNVNTFIVYSSDIYSKSIGETEDKLKEVFNKASSNMPSIILLEDIDSLCPKTGILSTNHERRMITQLITFFDDLQSNNKDILVMATTAKLDLVDSSLRRFGRLDTEIEIYIPTPNMRMEILVKLLSKIPNTLSDENVQKISYDTHGFVGADLKCLCSRAIINARKCQEKDKMTSNDKPIVTMIDFNNALTITKPSAMKEILIDVPNVKWSDIGGQKELKLKLQQAVDWPLTRPEVFVRMGITPPRGVLMFGPPGCSKTMIAKALATESKLNFINIKGPELFSKWVGESEKAVREVFRKAKEVAPSIIFIDEIDALGSERRSSSDSSGTHVHERVLAQLLIELDGVTPLGNVTLVAATNRPDRIDKALLRPGRLDRVIYVGLPDEETRREIFDIKLRNMPVAEEVNIIDLVSLTKGYSGAEIQAICHEAAMKALEEDLNAITVTKEHFEVACKTVTPRTPASFIKMYEEYMNKNL